MKKDSYTKMVLTVIAICLIIIVLNQMDLMPSANASSPSSILDNHVNYGLVPLNTDGTIDVNVKSISSDIKVKVDIEEVGGWWVGGSSLPIKAKN
jgi:hypothetical protein